MPSVVNAAFCLPAPGAGLPWRSARRGRTGPGLGAEAPASRGGMSRGRAWATGTRTASQPRARKRARGRKRGARERGLFENETQGQVWGGAAWERGRKGAQQEGTCGGMSVRGSWGTPKVSYSALAWGINATSNLNISPSNICHQAGSKPRKRERQWGCSGKGVRGVGVETWGGGNTDHTRRDHVAPW